MTDTNLFDFEQREAPEFVPGERLTRPDGTPVGHLGVVTNRSGEPTAYWSVRTRSEHLFKKFDGYAVSTSVLDTAIESGAETVFIDEGDGPLFEFDITQFIADGIVLDFEDYDKQLCVPTAEARETWNSRR